MEIEKIENCIICEGPIADQGKIACSKCGKECTPEPVDPKDLDRLDAGDPIVGFNGKSDCCGAEVRLDGVKSTCSPECNEKLVEMAEKQFGGKTFEEIDMNGDIRLIPVRDIVEKGALTEAEITKYPLKKKAGHSHTHEDGLECLACKLGPDGYKRERERMKSEHGWIVDMIHPSEHDKDGRSNFVTDGVEEKFSHPEIQVMLHVHNPKIPHMLIHTVVGKIKHGAKFEAGKRYGDILTLTGGKDADVMFEWAKHNEKKVLRMIVPGPNGEFSGPFYDKQVKDILKNLN